MKAVLFDHDGVLVDSETAFFETTREAFAKAGAALSREVWSRLYLAEGKRSREVARAVGLAEDEIEQVIAGRDHAYRRRVAEGIAFRRGAQETVEALRDRARLALVTGGPRSRLETLHAVSGFLESFDFVVTADECARVKPDPAAYLMAMDRLGLSPADCLAVEDSPRGLAAAHAAGLRCLLVPTELTDLSLCTGAWMTVPDLTEALPLLRAWSGQPSPA